MTNNSLTHSTPDDDSDELDTGVDVQSAMRLDAFDAAMGLPRHGAHGPAADGGHTSPALTAVAALIGFVIGGGVYGLEQAGHAKQHTPAAEIIKLPAPTRLTDMAKVAPAEAKKDNDEPEAKPAAASEPAEKVDPESEMLETARGQLSSGNAAAALMSLEHMRKRFPKGNLAQDRDLLRIDALKAKGQRAAAKTAARKFAKAHPNNPHLGELESLLIGQ